MVNKTPLIVTIDFDDTIVDSDFPKINTLYHDAKRIINKWYEQGIYIIISTCRTGREELEAEMYLVKNGIHFHKLNGQHPYGLLTYGSEEQVLHRIEARKIYSHIHIDNTNIDWVENGHPGWLALDDQMQRILNKQRDRFGIQPQWQ